MWTEAHRARHDARLKEIVSLHAVAQVARWLERADPPRSGRATPYGAVVRAIAWHLRIGGAWPSLRQAILDGAFTAARCQEWSNRHGMRPRVVERDPAQTGFVVLAGRWVVERSFGWLVHWGGLLRDRAGRLDVSAARVACAAALSGVEALLNPVPIQDAAS